LPTFEPTSLSVVQGHRTNPLARERAAREAEGWARYTTAFEFGVR
jgi:hypothetical protein